jgi:hypothetical protein
VRAARLPVFSRGSREVAVARGAEAQRLRERGEQREEWGERRKERVAPLSVRVERPKESRAALRRFAGRLDARGERLRL